MVAKCALLNAMKVKHLKVVRWMLTLAVNVVKQKHTGKISNAPEER